MGEEPRAGVPAWAPASVASAYRRGTGDAEALLTGAAWDQLLDHLRQAATIIRSDRAPGEPVDQAAGYRHLLVLLALGIDEALHASDPHDPHIGAGNVDNVLKWGMDCPDAAYRGASLRGDGVYRISGWRGTCRYLGLQVMGGMASAANVVVDDLDIDADGRFELLLCADRRPGNWMPLDPGAQALIVRQFFYDWETEEPSRLTIERLGEAPSEAEPVPMEPAGLGRQIVALGEFVTSSLRFWLDIEEAGRAEGINCFRQPAARTDMGGAAENVTVWGSWDLADGEALIIEVAPPDALYWSVSIGNYWWETIDYANHQSSLNGHQATLDGDGVFRAVVSHTDPGVANWLDTAGHRRGPAIFRFVRADGEAPVPATRVVALSDLDAALPPGTARVDAATRRQVIARRREGVRRRFHH